MAYDADWVEPDETTLPTVDYPDMPPEMMAQYQQKTVAPEQVDYPDMPPDMVAQFRQPAAAPEQVDYPDMPEAEAVKLGLKQAPVALIKSAPATATPAERRDIYGDEPIGLPRTPGGLSSTAGATVTSTVPTQDIPAPKTNRAGETLPTYVLRSLGEGMLSLPQRATQAAGMLQRQGDVYDPAPAIEAVLMGYGARSLAGAHQPRPLSNAPVPRPRQPAGVPVTPEGQYQFPLEGAHQPVTPETPVTPDTSITPSGPSRVPLQGELPLQPPPESGVRHGSPGSEAAAGTAEAQPPPPGSKARGPEDWGKKTEPSAPGEATGVNVGEVDPTLRQVLAPEPLAPTPAGTMELPPVEVRPAAVEPPPVREVRPEPAAPRPTAIEHDPMDMARRGELSAARAEELAQHYQNRDKQVVDAVLGKDADAWRRAHKLSDQYWNSGYNDAKARVQDKLVEALETKHPPETIEAMYRKLEQSEHTDPQGWRDFARDLRDVEGSRENAVTTVGYTLRRLPEAGKALGQIDRETLAVIQHALDREAKRGGNPDAFLRDAFAKSSERYGGGADAAEIIAGDMARLKELMRNPPQERAVQALSAPKPKQPELVRQQAPQEQFGGIAPPKITPETRPIEPTGRPVPEGARAEVNKQLDAAITAKDPIGHLRETATRARELGLEGQARRIESAAAELERQRTVGFPPGPGERSTGTLRQQQEGPLQRLRDFIADEQGGGRLTRKPVPTAVAKAQDAVLDRIAPDPGILDKLPGSRSEARRSLMSFYQWGKDQLHPLRETERLGPKLSADESFYQAARKSKGLAARVEQILERGTYDIKTRQVNGKSLRDAIKGVENDAGFDAYMAAKRAISLNNRGIKTGMPMPDANLVVSQTNKLYEQNFKDLIAFKNRNLDNLQKAGVLGADDVARMRALNPEHIPFYRALDKDTGLGQQLGAGLQVRDPVHGIKGSERKILHPMDSIIKDTMVHTDIAEKNLVMQKLEDWILKHDPNGKYFPRKQDVRAIDVSAGEMNKFMKEHGITDELTDAMTIFRKNAFRPDENSFRVYRDGKPRTYGITDEAPAALGKAINGLDQDTVGMLTKIASYPAKTLRTGATTTLEFMAKNIGRDNISAFINTKGFRPGYDMIKGAVSTFMKDEHYQRAAIEGGLNATMVAMDRNKALKMHPKDFVGQVTHVINPKNWLSVLQDISEFSENATRMGMYKRAIAQGKTPAEAAFIMREGTLDFQRIGGNQQVKAFNMITPFFNVSLEGLDRTIRAFKNNPVATPLKVAASITLPSLLLWNHNKDDPRYQEMEWWRKDLFFNFFTDKWVNMSAEDASRIEPAFKRQAPDGSWQRNDGIIWSFPKPFEAGVIFGSLPERLADYLYRKDPKAWKDIGKTLVEGFTPSIIPQIVVPIAEQWGNRSLFTDRAVVPEYMKKLSPEEQYGTRTSEVAKWAGKQLSAFLPKGSSFGSPMVLENYVQGYAGGLGRYVLDAMDKGLELSGAVKPGIKPAATEADIYGLRAFVARAPGAGAQSIQQFYDIWGDRKTSKADVSHMRRSGRPEEALAERRENAALQVAEGTHKQIGFLHERIRRVMRDPDMTPEAKREKIDVAYLQMISAARNGINKFNARKAQLEGAR